MDYNRIGNFIANERKAKNLTQAKLGELVFVSEKTISKWENGNGIPDTNSLPKLCEVFGVSLNELLNGGRMSKEEYKNTAEKELLKLQKEKEETTKLLLNIEKVLVISTLILMFANYYFAIYIIEKFAIYVLPTIMIVFSLAVFLVACLFALKIEQKAGYYKCSKCGHKHIPAYSKTVCAMHFGRTRYLECPKCKQKSWNKKVLK